MIYYEGFPWIVGWELTVACNLRCEHCGSTAGLPRARELSLREALDICDQFPDLLVYEVDFTGGEPLLWPDWWRIVARLRELKIQAKLITNGLLLGTETIACLKDVGIARVGVSIDGLRETHDRIRKRDGLFAQILSGIEGLRQAGIPVSVITTVNALNVGQLPELFFLLRSLDVDIWQIQPLFPLGRARDCAQMALSEPAYLQMGWFVRDHGLLSAEGRPTISPGDSYGYFSDLDQRQPPWGGCSAGLDVCGITSNGHVKGCLSMPDELAEGDLRQRDLWDIWFDENAFAYNRKFTAADLGSNCSGCGYAETCRGGCASMSYACTGMMHNDPYCFWRLQQPGVADKELGLAAR